MQAHGSAAELAAFDRSQQRRASFYAIVSKYRRRLDQLYTSGLPESEMAQKKAAIFADLDTEYQALKQSWGGFKGYDRWLGPNANNASLASVAVYTHLVPAFQALLERSEGNLPRFYEEARRLAAMPKQERRAMLNALTRHAELAGAEQQSAASR
jgi:predicted aminopeptidase